MIVLRGRPWTRQPDRRVGPASNSGLTRGLAGLFDGQTRTELASMARFSSDSSTGVLGPAGRARRYTGASSQSSQWAHQSRFAVLGPITIMAYLDVVSKTNYGGIISKQATASTAVPFEFRLGTNATDGDLNFTRANGTNYSQWKSTVGAGFVGTGNRQIVGARSTRASIDNPPSFFANGVFASSSQVNVVTDANPPTDNGSSAVTIGSRNAGTTFLDGRVYWVAVWNRALSDDEMRQIWRNPWILFESVQREISQPPDAPAPTFLGAWVPRRARHIGLGVH